MTICRVCDQALKEDQLTYLRRSQKHIYFKAVCDDGHETCLNEQGDVVSWSSWQSDGLVAA